MSRRGSKKPKQPSPSIDAAGVGGSSALPPGIDPIKDRAILTQAVRGRWPIAEEFRPGLTQAMIAIVASKQTTPREKSAAFRNLLAADALNMEQERRDKETLDAGGVPGLDASVDKTIVTLIEDEGWYGNDAHSKAAERAEQLRLEQVDDAATNGTNTESSAAHAADPS